MAYEYVRKHYGVAWWTCPKAYREYMRSVWEKGLRRSAEDQG